MGEALRDQVLARTRRAVVKVGSAVVAPPGEGPRPPIFESLARGVVEVVRGGRPVVLVTSGAIASGVATLGWGERPRALADLQAAASVGQTRLMRFYEEAFARRGVAVAQVLLTHDDVRNRRRYLNARSTLQRLLALGVVPIVNENDTVSVEEIRVGDNDTLASLVVQVVEADLLVILSDIDGLYTRDPKIHPDAERIPVVENPSQAAAHAGGGHGRLSVGGMATKVEAARRAAALGAATVLADGRGDRPLERIFAGEPLGTLFLPRGRLKGRKRWIALALHPSGGIVVDDGALKAIQAGGKSLLPAGIVQVEGSFEAGSAVAVRDRRGREVARGLAAYGSEDLRRIRGAKSAEIEARLGRPGPSEVIHRDDLVLL